MHSLIINPESITHETAMSLCYNYFAHCIHCVLHLGLYWLYA